MSDLLPAALAEVTILERGWLSANNVVLHGAPGEFRPSIKVTLVPRFTNTPT